ncbi:MAG: hypothetical protein GY906_39040 [bacterium]|nr:hypothetical protein [bacterium]
MFWNRKKNKTCTPAPETKNYCPRCGNKLRRMIRSPYYACDYDKCFHIITAARVQWAKATARSVCVSREMLE